MSKPAKHLNTSSEKPSTAKALFEALQQDGVIGMWKDRTDITDSLAFARKLREQAQHRNWD
jgi:hypothetical protein